MPPSLIRSNSEGSMTDRIALITGAAQGIGLACAEALAEDGCGPILVDIKDSVHAEARRLGGHSYICDMGDPEQIAALFDKVEAEVGPVSVLVNNAGIAIGADFLEMTEAQFRKVLDVNLVGVFLATQRAAKTMVAEELQGAI